MNVEKNRRLLVDCREFSRWKSTGIARFLEGLLLAASEEFCEWQFILAVGSDGSVPVNLSTRTNTTIMKLPAGLLLSEATLSICSRKKVDVFLSPYPKLPLFGCFCSTIHTVHDVLDIAHPAYRRRIRRHIDTFRVRAAMRQADLTWYDSTWSMKETKSLIGFTGRKAEVRHLGLDDRFTPAGSTEDAAILEKYGLRGHYILVLGNGLPHKNLGVLLQLEGELHRKLVFVGVSDKNRSYWKEKYGLKGSVWLEGIPDEEIPAIIRKSFCLAQPSTAEGYGYPPLEAMGCGVPAVVSDVPVLIETTGGTALRADPNDGRAWKEAFSALEQKDVYRRTAQEGLRWVEPLRGRKGWQRHVSDIKELIARK